MRKLLTIMAWGIKSHLYDVTGMDIQSLQGITDSSEVAWIVVINLFCSSAFPLWWENVLNTRLVTKERRVLCSFTKFFAINVKHSVLENSASAGRRVHFLKHLYFNLFNIDLVYIVSIYFSTLAFHSLLRMVTLSSSLGLLIPGWFPFCYIHWLK